MCGITGIIHYKTGKPVDKQLIRSMTEPMIHRGPDDYGAYTNNHVGLGFRRLSIIDLKTGNQPIFNETKSIVTVCNGEIFNYSELTEKLKLKGHGFYTNCDIEVLVHLYEEYGKNLMDHLNGQYGLAVYDKGEDALLLSRDHAGIAPLFYTETDDGLLFASEIKALLKHPDVKRQVELKALDQVFTFPGIISPNTLFKGIYSLKPGHRLIVKNGGYKVEQFWDLEYPTLDEVSDGKPESYYVDRLEELLTQSVNYRLKADVPVGFYLSGGLDSSVIAALIYQHHSEKRHSFSIGFSQKEIDERYYQKLMSDSVGSIHHEAVFDWPEISERLKQAIYHTECPLKESFDTCSLKLSELARNNDVKVVLNGEGSDELFAGYIGFRYDQNRSAEEQNPYDMNQIMEASVRERLWGDSAFHYERNLTELSEVKQALYSPNLADGFDAFDATQQSPIDTAKVAGRHPIHKRSYIDFKLRLADHLLSDHGDRVAHANSIEARYPFLDVNVIDFVRTIPPQYLVNGGSEKYILKQVAKRHVPKPIIQREKFAFTAPGSPYLLKQNIEWINDLLSYETIKRQGYFNPDTIEHLKRMYTADGFSLIQVLESDLLMIVLTFGLFLEIFDMPNS